jgi:L-alanine-DL-glutamate epimerase-like enolase superfamily enzyme
MFEPPLALEKGGINLETKLSLYAANLNYPIDLQVNTATSGSISSLSERYLMIERSDGFTGVGEVRANISYLSGISEDLVDAAIRDLCLKICWSLVPEDILSTVRRYEGFAPHLAMAAVENALIEGIAISCGISVCEWLGGRFQNSVETNQCLFWSPDERFDRLARRFLTEGFRHFKVRVGVGQFKHDLERLTRLRELVGTEISIAVDANGSWTPDEAIENLRMLEKLCLSYVEQPTKPRDWDAFRKVADSTSTILMADEGLKNMSDVEELCRLSNRALAHLKIVKLGGPSALVASMKKLNDAGVGVMIGQMNEGAMATAITAHSVMALQPEYAELYGCYGLLDDVTQGVGYLDGQIVLPTGVGLGTRFDPSRCRRIWTEKLSG